MPPRAARQYWEGGGVGGETVLNIKKALRQIYLAYCPAGRVTCSSTRSQREIVHHEEIHYTSGGREFLLRKVLDQQGSRTHLLDSGFSSSSTQTWNCESNIRCRFFRFYIAINVTKSAFITMFISRKWKLQREIVPFADDDSWSLHIKFANTSRLYFHKI